MDVTDWLSRCPLVAILRGVKPDAVEAIGEALVAAGVVILEVPLNSPEPVESVRRLAARLGDRARGGGPPHPPPARGAGGGGTGGGRRGTPPPPPLRHSVTQLFPPSRLYRCEGELPWNADWTDRSRW